MDSCQKKSRHLQESEPRAGIGDYWVWTASSLPSRLRLTSDLSQHRSEAAATTFIQQICGARAGQATFFTSDKLPAYVSALVATYSVVEPPPAKRGRGRPCHQPKRSIDATYARV